MADSLIFCFQRLIYAGRPSVDFKQDDQYFTIHSDQNRVKEQDKKTDKGHTAASERRPEPLRK